MEEKEGSGVNWVTLLVLIGLSFVMLSVVTPFRCSGRGTPSWVKTSPAMTAVLNAFHDYAAEHDGYFPPAYDPKTGGYRWLDTTIYLQIYPEAKIAPDKVNGTHLQKTVFECPASLQQNPKETNWYNHSWVLNRDLITEAKFRQLPFPEYSPRKRSLFGWNDSKTMLLTEAIVGDYNSVSHTDFARIKAAANWRYDGEYVHVGFMDGHVERVKLRDIPKDLTNDDDAFFWTGLGADDLKAYQQDLE